METPARLSQRERCLPFSVREVESFGEKRASDSTGVSESVSRTGVEAGAYI